jgi:hypothetical protein
MLFLPPVERGDELSDEPSPRHMLRALTAPIWLGIEQALVIFLIPEHPKGRRFLAEAPFNGRHGKCFQA